MNRANQEQKLAVTSGYFPLFRYNPETQKFTLDSGAEFEKIDELLTNSINVSHIKNENLKRIRRKFSVASVDDNIKKILLS